jgi:putative ABC transport system substrate-binding protein
MTLLGSAAATWPIAARAQQPAMPVIGFLSSRSPNEDPHLLSAFREGLREVGHVEGKSVGIEYRFARGQYDSLPALAAGLVGLQVSVIASGGGVPAALAAKAATTQIPIVFNTGEDPVKLGIVQSLSRPGGNLTGVSNLNTELGPKRLELIHEVLPSARTIAFLVNPANPLTEPLLRDQRIAAQRLELELEALNASSDKDFELAFAAISKRRAGALVIGADAFFNSRVEQLALLTLAHRVPAIFQNREFGTTGGLLSYGGSIADRYRQMGIYVGRILNGEKVGELPVQQSTKIELIVNLKTARALGITVPLPLLGRADEVIE